MAEKSVRLPLWEVMRRRLEATDDPHHLLELFLDELLRLAGWEVNAPFIADVLKFIVDRFHAGDATPECWKHACALALKIIEALIDDSQVDLRARQIFTEITRRVPGM